MLISHPTTILLAAVTLLTVPAIASVNPQVVSGVLGLPAPSSSTFLDNGGSILPSAQVELIFWGDFSARVGPPPTITQAAVRTILSSSYTNSLHQYRGIGSAKLRDTVFLTDSSPPALFATADVERFLRMQIHAGALPAPDVSSHLLYAVIMPTTVHSQRQAGLGNHNSFRYFVAPSLSPFAIPQLNMAHFLWVTNDGGLPSVTSIFSHELVETMSDPDTNAIMVSNHLYPAAGHCPNNVPLCEIADVCDAVRWEIQGVTVASYWSQQDYRCYH